MNTDDVHRAWAERAGEFSPAYYDYYGADGTSERLRAQLDTRVGPDASVLELGCSSGRHLAHLREAGYEDLAGVDINPESFRVMAHRNPDLAASESFHVGAIEDVVPEFADDRFDAVFSVETLQHVPPGERALYRELHRVVGGALVVVENEGRDAAGRLEDRVQGATESGRDHGGDRTVDADAVDGAEDATAVTFVDDGLPLYHRDWEAVLTRAGFRQVHVEHLETDTMRVFEPGDA